MFTSTRLLKVDQGWGGGGVDPPSGLHLAPASQPASQLAASQMQSSAVPKTIDGFWPAAGITPVYPVFMPYGTQAAPHVSNAAARSVTASVSSFVRVSPCFFLPASDTPALFSREIFAAQKDFVTARQKAISSARVCLCLFPSLLLSVYLSISLSARVVEQTTKESKRRKGKAEGRFGRIASSVLRLLWLFVHYYCMWT